MANNDVKQGEFNGTLYNFVDELARQSVDNLKNSVKNTYSATSEDPISGKGVAQSIPVLSKTFYNNEGANKWAKITIRKQNTDTNGIISVSARGTQVGLLIFGCSDNRWAAPVYIELDKSLEKMNSIQYKVNTDTEEQMDLYFQSLGWGERLTLNILTEQSGLSFVNDFSVTSTPADATKVTKKTLVDTTGGGLQQTLSISAVLDVPGIKWVTGNYGNYYTNGKQLIIDTAFTTEIQVTGQVKGKKDLVVLKSPYKEKYTKKSAVAATIDCKDSQEKTYTDTAQLVYKGNTQNEEGSFHIYFPDSVIGKTVTFIGFQMTLYEG